MKIAGIIIGILLMLLGLVACVVCLLLPSFTNNRINMEEALLGLIPSILVLIFGFFVAVISAIFFFRSRKKIA